MRRPPIAPSLRRLPGGAARAAAFVLTAGMVAVALSSLPATSRSAELTVSAAASLGNVFREIAAAFEHARPDAKVLTNFGASGALLQQILAGAPVDVLASADQETMDRAASHGLLDTSRRSDFATNRLVVVVPADSTLAPSALADLAAPGLARIAIGVPSVVPAGSYARRALESAGLWARLEARTIGAHSVRQALDYVARGEVDAGFVYSTDASLMPDRVRVALAVPTEPIRYPIAPLAKAADPALARDFVAFVLSGQGQAILARHGFGPR